MAGSYPRSRAVRRRIDVIRTLTVSASASWQRSQMPGLRRIGRTWPTHSASSARISRPMRGSIDDVQRLRACRPLPRRLSTSETMNSMGSCCSCACRRARSSPDADDDHLRLQRAADLLVLSQRLERCVDRGRGCAVSRSHVRSALDRSSGSSDAAVGKQREVHGFLARARADASTTRSVVNGQNRREQAGEAVGHHDTSPSAPSAARSSRPQTCTGGLSRRPHRTRSDRRTRTRSRAWKIVLKSYSSYASSDLPRDLAVARQDVPVDFFERVERHAIARRVEVVQVR